MYLGWYDPDGERPIREKLADACKAYRDRFGADPECGLVSCCDLAALADAGHDYGALPLRGVAFVPANTFYLGRRE